MESGGAVRALPVRIALDTNVLAYAEGVNGGAMKQKALHLLQNVPADSVVLPVQTLGELFAVLTRKAGRPARTARAAVLAWRDAFPLVETSSAVLLGACDLALAHQLYVWDAVVVSAAAEADCRLLLSEDLQDGFEWRGLTVVNPFAASGHPLVEALMEPAPGTKGLRRRR